MTPTHTRSISNTQPADMNPSRRLRRRPIRISRRGFGCVPTPLSTPAMGSGGGRLAMTSAPRGHEKKGHGQWREEGLQVRARSPRKRDGVSSAPSIGVDTPTMLWQFDFRSESTIDGKATHYCRAFGRDTSRVANHGRTHWAVQHREGEHPTAQSGGAASAAAPPSPRNRLSQRSFRR